MTFFKKTKEIRSKKGELHFVRFTIFGCRWFSVNIHKIYKADKDKHLHNHPWNFWGIVLKGAYTEMSEEGYNYKSFLSFGYHNSERFHKIHRIDSGVPVVTLCIMGKRREEPWGYKVGNKFIDFQTYRQQKHTQHGT